MRNRTTTLSMVLTGALAVALSPTATSAEDTVMEAVEQLERKIEALQSELDRLKAKHQTTPVSPAGATLPSASPARPTATGEAQRSATPTQMAKNGLGAITERVHVGGYGSVRFEENSADDTHTTFNFRRFVLTTDASIAPRLHTRFELEFERFRQLELERSAEAEAGGLVVEQAIEGTNESEITLEQAWFQYDFVDPLRLRVGGILVPLGRFNLDHDDDRWDLPRRPLVDRGAPALPSKSAWAELGAGFNGELEVGERGLLDYHLYVVNGVTLEPEVEEVIQTREARRDKLALEAEFSIQSGTFGNDVDDGKAVTGRLAYSPAVGHELAGSFYWGRYTPDFLPDESIAAFAIDGIASHGAFELEWEYVYADFGDTDQVAEAFAATAIEQAAATPSEASPEFESEIEFELESLAERRQGYWIEVRYDTRPEWIRRSILGRSFQDPIVTAVFRGEQVWIDDLLRELDFTGGTITDSQKSDHRIDRLTLGAAYRPVPSVALQLAYEYTHVDAGSLGLVTNYLASNDDEAHALLLGTAFGF